MKVFEYPTEKPTIPYSIDPTPICGGIPNVGDSVFVRQKDRDGNISTIPILLESEVSCGTEEPFTVSSPERSAQSYFSVRATAK